MKPFKIAEVFNSVPKWRNFAKSGHTVSDRVKVEHKTQRSGRNKIKLGADREKSSD